MQPNLSRRAIAAGLFATSIPACITTAAAIDAGKRLPAFPEFWARLPLPYSPAEAWRSLPTSTQTEIGAAIVGMYLAQYVHGDGMAEADQFLDDDLRDAACDVEHAILNALDGSALGPVPRALRAGRRSPRLGSRRRAGAMTTVPTLAVQDGKPMADSRDVARFFDKQHKHVLAAIRELHCSPAFREPNFRPFKIKDLQGESTSHVLMTRDGFMFLAMGFTGAPAGALKEAFLARFNAMEAELAARTMPAVPTTFAEALQLAADNQRQVEAQAAQIAVLAPRSEALATIADTEGTFCIRDAAKMLDVPEKGFRAYLAGNGWIYRRGRSEPWVAHATRISQGYMRTKVVPVATGDGHTVNRPQARITSRGLTILAMRLGKPAPPEAAGNPDVSRQGSQLSLIAPPRT